MVFFWFRNLEYYLYNIIFVFYTIWYGSRVFHNYHLNWFLIKMSWLFSSNFIHWCSGRWGDLWTEERIQVSWHSFWHPSRGYHCWYSAGKLLNVWGNPAKLSTTSHYQLASTITISLTYIISNHLNNLAEKDCLNPV